MTTDFPDLLHQLGALFGPRPALREDATGLVLTYDELNRRASARATALRQWGLAPGDRVGVSCRNCAAFFETLFACARGGFVLVPFNWRMPTAELAPLIGLTEPAILLAGEEDRARLAAACTGAGRDASVCDLDDPQWLTPASPEDETALRDFWPADDPWYLLFTSGTTGQPKAVIQTVRMAIINHLNIGNATGLRAGDRTLNFLPLFHTAGINLHTLPVLFSGGEVIILPGFDPDRVLALAASGGVDSLFGVPAIYQALADADGFAGADLTRVRSWGCGGAPLPDHLVTDYLEKGVIVCNGMGMTETGPTLFIMRPDEVAGHIGAVGKPQMASAVRLVRPDGNTAASGEDGELQVKGPGITPGYWQNAVATKEAFTEDGWLKTGDQARQDTDGFYYLVGRLKDMYISGGENVFPAEVENALKAHPAIVEAVILAQPDKKWGETGRAFVVLKPEAAFDSGALQSWCREKLAGYKVPTEFVQLADIPRTETGKPKKHLLSELAGGQALAACFWKTLSQQDFNIFAEISGDDNPIHTDPDFAGRTRFGKTVAHGMYLLSLMERLRFLLAGQAPVAATRLMFPAPARVGDRLRLEGAWTDEEDGPALACKAVREADGETVCLLTVLPEEA